MAKTAPGRPRHVRILVVDDHPVVRRGLTELINAEPDFEVCAEAGRSAEALRAVETARPDLVVVDLSLGDESGLELIRDARARFPGLQCLVLSVHDEDRYAARALRAGAMGYIMKESAPEQLIRAVRQVIAGRVYLSDAVASTVLRGFMGPHGRKDPIDRLTDRELQVLRLLGKGLGTRQIAERLHISHKTVENHRSNMKSKLNIRTVPELIRFAVQFELGAGS